MPECSIHKYALPAMRRERDVEEHENITQNEMKLVGKSLVVNIHFVF